MTRFYKGCEIQKVSHPKLAHKYEVYKDGKHLGNALTLKQAKQLCSK